MSERMTVKAFVEMLQKAVSGAPDDALLRINGEYVDRMELVLQNPLVEEIRGDMRERRPAGPPSRKVFNILANGHEAPELPIETYDMRRW